MIALYVVCWVSKDGDEEFLNAQLCAAESAQDAKLATVAAQDDGHVVLAVQAADVTDDARNLLQLVSQQ